MPGGSKKMKRTHKERHRLKRKRLHRMKLVGKRSQKQHKQMFKKFLCGLRVKPEIKEEKCKKKSLLQRLGLGIK